MQYRKRPLLVNAFRLTAENRLPDKWPDWMLTAWCKEAGEPGAIWPAGHTQEGVYMRTIEGENARCDIGDWVIRGIKGELYPCKNDIFERTYECTFEPDAP